MKFVRSADFVPAAQVVQTELVQTGRLRLALGGLLRLIKAAPPPVALFGAPIDKLTASDQVDPLIALIGSGARYIAGEAPAKAPHYQVTTAVRNTMLLCDQGGPLLLVEKLFSTRLPLGCTGTDNGCKLAVRALIIPLRDLLANPTIRTFLSVFNVESIPEEGFVSLVKLFTTVFKSDVLDFTQVRALVQSILPFISNANLRTSLDQLTSVLEQLTKPEVGIQKALVSTLTCFEAQDTRSDVYRMAYNLVIDPDFQTSELLQAVDATTDLDPAGGITDWVAKVVAFLRADKATNDALIGLAGVMLEERNVARVLPTVLKMGDQGVVDDFRALMTRDACR